MSAITKTPLSSQFPATTGGLRLITYVNPLHHSLLNLLHVYRSGGLLRSGYLRSLLFLISNSLPSFSAFGPVRDAPDLALSNYSEQFLLSGHFSTG